MEGLRATAAVTREEMVGMFDTDELRVEQPELMEDVDFAGDLIYSSPA